MAPTSRKKADPVIGLQRSTKILISSTGEDSQQGVSEFHLAVHISAYFLVIPIMVLGMIWGVTGPKDGVSFKEVSMFVALFLSGNLLHNSKIELSRGKHSFLMNLSLIPLTFLNYNGNYRFELFFWLLGMGFVWLWERHLLNGLAWTFANGASGVVGVLAIKLFILSNIPEYVSIFLGMIVAYIFFGILSRTFTYPVRASEQKHFRTMLKKSSVSMIIGAIIIANFLSYVVEHREELLGIIVDQSPQARGFMLLALSSTVCVIVERLRFRNLQRQFNSLIEATLRLPWGKNEHEAHQELISHTLQVLPKTEVELSFSVPKEHEMGVAIDYPTGERRYLKVTRKSMGNPFTASDDAILHGIAHIGMVNLERIQERQRLTEVAETDPLTELMNYRGMHRILMEARQEGYAVAGIFIDIDDFKIINDLHGHRIGNEILIMIAQRIRVAMRPQDFCIRIGGDEFLVLMLNTPEPIVRNLQKLLEENLNLPYLSDDGQSLPVGVSLGLTVVDKLESIGSFLESSDEAMYHEKRLKTGHFHNNVQMQDNGDEVLSRGDIADIIRDTVTQGRVDIGLQPIVDYRAGQIKGFEALARFHQPGGESISNAVAIQVAYQQGLAMELTTQVLDLACDQVKRLQDLHKEIYCVHVNIEVGQLLNPEFQAKLIRKVTEFPTLALTLELTENSLYQADAKITEIINRLRFEHGITFAMDDFGKQFSSLHAIVHFPVDLVKMDRSFSAALTEEGDRSSLVITALLQVAGPLKFDIILEGVECLEQAEIAKEAGIDVMQGYYFGKPLTFDDMKKRIEKHGLSPCPVT